MICCLCIPDLTTIEYDNYTMLSLVEHDTKAGLGHLEE